MSSPTSHANAGLPNVDERLVAPESGYEIDDKIAALLEAHAAGEFEVAVTRSSACSRDARYR